MRKIINGKSYDTKTAKQVASWSTDLPVNDFHYYEETLYLKRTGEYFIYGHGGPASKYAETNGDAWQSGEDILPMTLDKARKWGESKLDAGDYERIFGKVSEGTELKDLHVQIPANLYRKTKDHPGTLAEVVQKALTQYLG